MTDTYDGRQETSTVPRPPNIYDRLNDLDERVANIYDRLNEIDARLDRIENAIGLDIGPVPAR